MKILFTHRYFWPDSPPYGLMLKNLASAVANDGHEVHVYTTRPSYRTKADKTVLHTEIVDGVHVKRGSVLGSERSNSIIRFLNVIIYCIGLAKHILFVRPDVVTAATFPPVIAAWVASSAAQYVGARFIYHMQDIHPEVSKYSGGFLGGGLQHKILVWLDNQTMRRTSEVVVLSEDMKNTLLSRNGFLPPVVLINNPPVTSSIDGELPPMEYRKDPKKIRIIFAGNLGRFQNLSLLTDGVAECFAYHPEIELVFLGDGNAKPSLMRKWGRHSQVKFLPFVPFSQARSLLEDSDVGLVSLQKDIYRVSFPSKMTTYLSIGLPVLVLVEAESELATLTNKHGLGSVPEDMTKQAVSVALKSLLANKSVNRSECDWYSKNCSPEANKIAWLKLLNSTT